MTAADIVQAVCAGAVCGGVAVWLLMPVQRCMLCFTRRCKLVWVGLVRAQPYACEPRDQFNHDDMMMLHKVIRRKGIRLFTQTQAHLRTNPLNCRYLTPQIGEIAARVCVVLAIPPLPT
jgi:hypothetical protein